MVYVIQMCWQLASRIRTDLVPSWSCWQAVWHIPLLCVPWKTPDDGQRNCPRNVEFYSKSKFEKLVRLVGFVIRIYLVFVKNTTLFSTVVPDTGREERDLCNYYHNDEPPCLCVKRRYKVACRQYKFKFSYCFSFLRKWSFVRVIFTFSKGVGSTDL